MCCLTIIGKKEENTFFSLMTSEKSCRPFLMNPVSSVLLELDNKLFGQSNLLNQVLTPTHSPNLTQWSTDRFPPHFLDTTLKPGHFGKKFTYK
jgi:hypothetical protein